MFEERRRPKNRNMRKLFWENIAKHNVRRSFLCSLSFTVILSVILILANTVLYKDEFVPLLLPGAFFAVCCGAFSFLCYFTLALNAREYYDFVSFAFVVMAYAFLCALTFLSLGTSGRMTFYSVGILLLAYAIVTTKKVFMLIEMIELVMLGVIVWTAERRGIVIPFTEYCTVGGLHLFGIVLSRENYYLRTEYTRVDMRSKKEMRQAERDPLTGLINRRGLERVTKQIYGMCVRQGDLVGMMIIDIDHFKAYNDNFGHVQGDKCLQTVAKRIADTVGDRGFTSRIGGEEFLVFLYGMDEYDMYGIAERIRADVENLRLPHATSKGAVVTISVGVYLDVPAEGTSFTSLYGRADKLLYKAKTTGRNKVMCNRKLAIPRTAKKTGQVNDSAFKNVENEDGGIANR